MGISRKVYPGQPGTKEWQKKYGNNLVCVRYKYDEKLKTKIVTVEIKVKEEYWQKNKKRVPKNKLVMVQVKYGEIDLGRKVRSLGGRWDKSRRLWELPFEAVQALGLENRIVDSGR